MTGSSGAGDNESRSLPEKDWKILRVVHAAALERYCSRVLQQCREILGTLDLTAHERYLRLFVLLRERDVELAGAFDDMRRSRAIHTLAAMIRLDVVATDELEQFSPRVRESALRIANITFEE